MDDEFLIKTVEKYRELYDMKHPEYSNVPKRDRIWEEIGSIMKQQGCLCRERWARIRDNYRKALILRKTKIVRGISKIKAPKYNKELSFIVPFLGDEEKRRLNDKNDEDMFSCVRPDILNVNKSTSPIPASFKAAALLNADDNTGSGSDNASSRGKKRPASNETDIAKPYLVQIENPNASSTFKNDNTDPLIDFFVTMAKTVKTFPIHEQVRLKAELFQIVNSAELRLATNASVQSQRMSYSVEVIDPRTETEQDAAEFSNEYTFEVQQNEDTIEIDDDTSLMYTKIKKEEL